jgi:hypothetical protein
MVTRGFLLSLALAATAWAQPAPAPPTADALRTEIHTLAWLRGLELTPDQAREWAQAIDGAPNLLRGVESQENDPSVIAALTALRAKVLRDEALTDDDWQTVDTARCAVVAAQSLPEPADRRVMTLTPLAARLSAGLPRAQWLVLAEPDRLTLADSVLEAVIAVRHLAEGAPDQLTNALNAVKGQYEKQGDLVVKQIQGLIDAVHGQSDETFAKGRRHFRDECLEAMAVDYDKKLQTAAATALAHAIVEKPNLAAALRLLADAPH